jgi:hypothetical protein
MYVAKIMADKRSTVKFSVQIYSTAWCSFPGCKCGYNIYLSWLSGQLQQDRWLSDSSVSNNFFLYTVARLLLFFLALPAWNFGQFQNKNSTTPIFFPVIRTIFGRPLLSYLAEFSRSSGNSAQYRWYPLERFCYNFCFLEAMASFTELNLYLIFHTILTF